MRSASGLVAFAAIVAAMSGCTQEDQVLSFKLADDEPVTRTVPASGEVTISTPAGMSVTLPEGTVTPGTKVTAQLVDASKIAGVPDMAGNVAFLLSFEEPPKKDPVVTFTNTFNGSITALQLLSAVPAAIRVSTDGPAPSGTIVVPSWSVAPGHGDYSPVGPEFPSFFGDKITKLIGGVLSTVFGISAPTQFSFDESSFLSALEEHLKNSGYRRVGGLFGLYANPNVPIPYVPKISQVLSLKSMPSSALETCDEVPSPCNLLIITINAGASPLGALVDPSSDEQSAVLYPLIPEGASSASFGLVCTGVPVGGNIDTCGPEVVDVRASQKLLDRYAGSLVAIKYFAGVATLRADGTGNGLLMYDVALRVPMAAGVAGYAVEDSLDLNGNWSVDGNRITVAGHTFTYATPAPDYAILSVDDSVKVKNNDGTESWERVQAHLKLERIVTH